MAEIIRMPRLSDTMEEGNIIGWMKKVGDSVKPGDILAEVETDKATMELENFIEGTLLHIGVTEGAVPVDGVIAIIGEKGEDINSILAEASGSPNGEKKEEKQAVSAAEQPKVDSPQVESKTVFPQNSNTVSSQAVSHDAGRVFASPLAKKIAAEKNIDLSHVHGSGDQGRIVKADIENYQPSTPSTQAKSSSKPASQFQYGTVAVSQMRKTIARRLGESKFQAPHFYLTSEIDMDNAIAARNMMNEKEESRISFNDILVKACALALRKHPYINGSWNGDTMTFHEDIHIGVAVAVEEGLLVPVVRHADAKSLEEIYADIRALAEKAKNKKLGLEEMSGNTFTISNLGMFGITEFTAIINPPDACILAVGTIVEKPVVKNGAIVIGNTMKVTLSCDHRIVDGAKGAEFLETLRSYLENPMKMLR